MTLEVLISCMHQKNTDIIQKSNIQSDVVIVNQCDINKTENITFQNHQHEECKARIIHTTERGLSKSRNLNNTSFPKYSSGRHYCISN